MEKSELLNALIAAGISDGFIRNIEKKYNKLQSKGISQDDYKQYIQFCERFTNNVMRAIIEQSE